LPVQQADSVQNLKQIDIRDAKHRDEMFVTREFLARRHQNARNSKFPAWSVLLDGLKPFLTSSAYVKFRFLS